MGVGPHASGRGWGPARNQKMQTWTVLTSNPQPRPYRAIDTRMATTCVSVFSPALAVISIR